MTNDIRAKLVTWSSIDSETISKNISRKFVAASKSMIAQLYLKQGAVVPKHHHESEQLSYILEGISSLLCITTIERMFIRLKKAIFFVYLVMYLIV